MDIRLPNEIIQLMGKIAKAGFEIYVVGGAVRDLLLNKNVKDWDFTTSAKPEEILKIFPDGFYNNKFGTVGVPSGENIFEITTMRKEGDYKDFRHPVDVSWTDKIEDDLARRDFTVNAIALSQDLKLVDPYGGQDDLKSKIVKTVGDADKRFNEDALRLMRAVRFCAQLGFDIEKETFHSIQKNAELIKNVAWERIRDELFKILASKNPYEGFMKLKEARILQIILPELERCFGLEQEGPKHDREYDIGEHCLLALKHAPTSDPLVRLAALLHDIGKPDTHNIQSDGNVTFYNHEVAGGRIVSDIARRLNLSNDQKDKLYRLVRWHMFSVNEHQTDAALRRFIKNVGLENIDDMMALLGVNRALVTQGLKVLNRTENLGLKTLIIDSGLVPGQIGSFEIGHMIGPRLNAIGRLEHAIDALRLLCTKEPEKARRLSGILNTSNTLRQKMTIESFDQAKAQIGSNGKEKIHVLSSRDWHPGIIGLIAARVCEEFYRPAIAISDGGDFAKGSARSIKGIHITDLIRNTCSDILVAVGGHSGAAGFTIESKYIPEFTKKLKEAMAVMDLGERKIDIEAQIESKQITKSLVRELDKMEPFGLSNPKPILATMNMGISDIRTLSEGKHLKFKADGIDCIAFGMGGDAGLLRKGNFVNLAYIPDINKYNGSETLQLKVKDIQIV